MDNNSGLTLKACPPTASLYFLSVNFASSFSAADGGPHSTGRRRQADAAAGESSCGGKGEEAGGGHSADGGPEQQAAEGMKSFTLCSKRALRST